MSLRRHDLNLLVALDALLNERSVTLAARRVGLSQPALSKALGRLRVMFDDPLLVRVGRELKPTPRAVALMPDLQRLLHEATDLIRPHAFDPAAARGTVRFASTDAVTESVLTPWIRDIAARAPALRYEVVNLGPENFGALAKGDLDFAVDVYPDPIEDCRIEPLAVDRFVCLVRRGHPDLSGQALTRKRYAALSHVQLTATGGGGGLLERELARVGVTREVILGMASMTTAAYVVSQTDWAITINSIRARTSAQRFALDIHELPFKLRHIPLSAVWHRRTDQSPLHLWLRERLRAAVAPGAGLLVPWAGPARRR